MRAAAPSRSSSLSPGLVLGKATLRAAQELGLNGSMLARVLGLSDASVSRLQAGQRPIEPASKEGELATLLIRVYRSLDALVGNDAQKRLAWMGSQNHALNGVPRDLVQTAQGLVLAVSYLDSMRATL